MKVGQRLRPLLPAVLRAKVPADAAPAAAARDTLREHQRKVLVLAGCVQPAMRPTINLATLRVLDRAGIQAISVPGAGCCGALRAHLNDREGSLAEMRRNIDA